MGAVLISTELLIAAFFCGVLYSTLEWGSRQLAYASSATFDQQRFQLWKQNLRGITLLSFGIAFTAILGFNGWLLYEGRDVIEYTMQLFRSVPRRFWISLTLGVTQSVFLLWLVSRLLKPMRKWLRKASLWAQAFDDIDANDFSVDRFFLSLFRLVRVGLWLAALLACLKFLQLPDIALKYLHVALSIYLIVSAGMLLLAGLAVFFDSVDGLTVKYSDSVSIFRFYKRVQGIVPFLRRCFECAIWVCVATLVVSQIEIVSSLATYGPILVKVIGVVSITRILTEVIHLSLERLFLGTAASIDELKCKRRGTILPLLESIFRYIIYFGAGMVVLRTIGFDPTPILAGAGIVGLTVGLGAQSMVRDIVSGFFILFEDCYLVGDFIETDAGMGIVDSIQLRTTRIMNPNGQIHILRNGDIGTITNYSKNPIDAVVKASISYEADPKQACAVIRRLGESLCASDPDVLEPTRIEGIEPFGETTIHIFTRTKVSPGKHLRIKRLLRHQILMAFLEEDVEMVPMDTKLMLKGGRVAFSDDSTATLSLT